MFRRRSTDDPGTGTDTPAADVEELGTGKGRPTPSRREAEEARKKRLKPPRDRKEMAKRQRQRRTEDRQKMRAALSGGDEKHLPPRDRGPVRGFVRDLVDSRRNIAEYLLPLLVVILTISFVPRLLALQFSLWTVTIIATALDTVWLGLRLRRELRARFERGETKGALAYGLLRSTQLRRLRLPKPRIARGQPLPTRPR